MVKFNIWKYFYEVLLKIFSVSIIVYSVLFYFQSQYSYDKTFVNLVFVILVSFLLCFISIYFVGLSKNDRSFLRKIIVDKLIRKKAIDLHK